MLLRRRAGAAGLVRFLVSWCIWVNNSFMVLRGKGTKKKGKFLYFGEKRNLMRIT